MKKIGFISHGASGGGSERVCAIVANYFVKKGYEVYFFAVHSDRITYHLDPGIHYVYCDDKKGNKIVRFIHRAQKLKNTIKEEKIDTIISFVYEECLFLLSTRVQKIFSLRNDPSRASWAIKRVINILYRRADRVVFQTPDARDFFCEKIRKKGVIIANPLTEGLPEWNAAEHDKNIIAAGRLWKQKNFIMLIKAFADFLKECPDYSLTICGEGEGKGELVDLTRELEIENKVTFPGNVNDLHERMTKSAIYVSSSDYEGISNSMLEALAIGIPSICTDCPVGGARMFIKDGVNGNLVPVGDHETLAVKMKALAKDKAMQERFFEQRNNIRKELDVAKICDQWTALI